MLPVISVQSSGSAMHDDAGPSESDSQCMDEETAFALDTFGDRLQGITDVDGGTIRTAGVMLAVIRSGNCITILGHWGSLSPEGTQNSVKNQISHHVEDRASMMYAE